jgi:GxxExxY protein
MALQDIPLRECDNRLTEAVILAAIEVHREFGSGLFEAFYQQALCMILRNYGLAVQMEVEIRPVWQGVQMPLAYRADMIVEDCLLLELKAVERIHPIHATQVISYLKLMRIKTGLLLNFHVPILKEGIRRFVI